MSKGHKRLSVIGQPAPKRERADARLNRKRILAATRKLLESQPIDEICMDAVAAEAGVGKGTLYRRFESRAALCMALLDDDTKGLQDRVIAGLGLPEAATSLARIERFLPELFELVYANRKMLVEANRNRCALYDHPGHA